MSRRVSASEASRSFSDILNRVRYRGEAFIVERGGEAICRIEPVAPASATVSELIALLRETARPDSGYLTVVESLPKKQGKLPGSPWER